MYHGDKFNSGKTIRFKSEEPHHKNAVPYNRQKNKKNFRDYED